MKKPHDEHQKERHHQHDRHQLAEHRRLLRCPPRRQRSLAAADEPVADAAHGPDEARPPRVVAELLAQAADQHVDRAVVGFPVDAARLVQDALAGEHRPRLRTSSRAARTRRWSARARALEARRARVQFTSSAPARTLSAVVVAARAAAPPGSAPPARAARTAWAGSRRRPARGRRCGRMTSPRAVSITIGTRLVSRILRHTAKPSMPGQHHVEDHDVRRVGLRARAARRSGCVAARDREAEPAEVLGEQRVQRLVVVDDKHARAGAGGHASYDPAAAATRARDRREGARPCGPEAPKPRPSDERHARTRPAAPDGQRHLPLVPSASAAPPSSATAPDRPAAQSQEAAASLQELDEHVRGVAPTAMRRPISAVRSFTDRNISARIPVPPTSIETRRQAGGREASASAAVCAAAAPEPRPGPGPRSRRARLAPAR